MTTCETKARPVYSLCPGEVWMIPAGHQRIVVGLDMQILAQAGPYVAACVDEQPVWVAGIHPLWEGVGIGWELVLDREQLTAHVVPLLRLAVKQWKAWLHSGQWRWIEAQLDAGDSVSQRFLHWLGFKHLLYKHRFGPNREDVMLFVWRDEEQCFGT